MSRLLTEEEITRQLTELPAWRWQGLGLERTAALADYGSGLAVVNDVADEAEVMDHHPEMTLCWRSLAFVVTSYDSGGVTQRDIEMAHRIEAALHSRDLS